MKHQSPAERESVKVLRECIELQTKKSRDYQSDRSTVRQADYYPRGVESIYDMMNTKMLRLRSLMDAGGDPNFESLEDTARDLVNYTSFFAAYIRGGVDGQSVDRDMYNRPLPVDDTPKMSFEEFASYGSSNPGGSDPVPTCTDEPSLGFRRVSYEGTTSIWTDPNGLPFSFRDGKVTYLD
jgi:hypothetical protein